jgi:hypothetical protein
MEAHFVGNVRVQSNDEPPIRRAQLLKVPANLTIAFGCLSTYEMPQASCQTKKCGAAGCVRMSYHTFIQPRTYSCDKFRLKKKRFWYSCGWRTSGLPAIKLRIRSAFGVPTFFFFVSNTNVAAQDVCCRRFCVECLDSLLSNGARRSLLDEIRH